MQLGTQGKKLADEHGLFNYHKKLADAGFADSMRPASGSSGHGNGSSKSLKALTSSGKSAADLRKAKKVSTSQASKETRNKVPYSTFLPFILDHLKRKRKGKPKN